MALPDIIQVFFSQLAFSMKNEAGNCLIHPSGVRRLVALEFRISITGRWINCGTVTGLSLGLQFHL